MKVYVKYYYIFNLFYFFKFAYLKIPNKILSFIKSNLLKILRFFEELFISNLNAEVNPVAHTFIVWHMRSRVRRLVIPSYTLVFFVKFPFTAGSHRALIVFSINLSAANVLFVIIEVIQWSRAQTSLW